MKRYTDEESLMLGRDNAILQRKLIDALHEIEKWRTIAENLEIENKQLRRANATFGRPWQDREGETE
ncbi:MAG TPA: hypothetical protein VFT99_11075 [Roseiflexaceae bacterium]|nr:hypothetical protein [Roseiflexaceae bacterium]